ncbi:tetratricopeptide repeat protein [Nocardia sp. NPDC051750]|uniref:tetratricopeptide repeat protein n=1 Tax=Nocardia sp. NPDC051750 TaxID=3364325 RepID=UPI00378C2342
MGSEVFISHASGDAVLAEAIVHALEAAELSCWIAPRNILAGTDYAEAIIEAIEEAAVMVVVVSDQANRSRHVPREVERAIARDVSLVPFRIADIAPSKSLEYFLSSQHWLHALPPPVEAHIGKLVDAVSALVRLRRAGTADTSVATIANAVRRRPIRVPAPVGVFTGRAGEREKIAQELSRTTVVTLVGPPGAGKSELARRAAADLGAGVVFVDLSTVTVTSSLTSVVAAACGLDPAWDWRDVLAALDDTDTVLLLDNAETALSVDASGFRQVVRDVVTECRRVRVLATSRERIGLHGAESLLRVGPLPDAEAEELLGKLLSGGSVVLGKNDEQAVAQIRSLADGLPLALVISAAWLAEIPASAFLRSWERSREMLSTLPGFEEADRAASIYVSVAVSVDAVGIEAQRLLRVLSMLPAGASSELLDVVLGEHSLSATAELVRKSLVERSGTQLRMLVPIREFVLARAGVESLSPLVRAAIAVHIDKLRDITGSAYRLDTAAEWDSLQDTLANVGALVDRGLGDSTTTEVAIQLAVAAALAFRATGRIGEGVDHLQKALTRVPANSETAGNLQEESGHVLRAGARLQEAAACYQAALTTWTELGRTDREAVCRLRLGDVLRLLGRYPAAHENYTTALGLYRTFDDQLGLADAYECVGDVECMTGEFAAAARHYEQAQDMFRAIPDGTVGMVNTAHSLGETRLAMADVAGARVDYDQALSIATRIGDLQGRANALLGLAKTDLHEGELETARDRIDQAEGLYRQIDDRLGLANTQIALGDLHAATGDSTAADAAYERAEVALTAMASPANRILTSLRRVLGRQLAWDSPQVVRIRDEFARLVDRSVDVEECRRWPLERKGSVFHGGLELSS